MRFIIDAHLPKKVAIVFKELGHEAIHTSDLERGNATSDGDIIILASNDGIFVSKDEDFYQSFMLHNRPAKLIYVRVGNMRLRDLIVLFTAVAPDLIRLIGEYDLLEMHQDRIIGIS